MDRVGLRGIELAVAYTAACSHALSISGKNHRAGSEAVFVFELAFKNIRDDFHVAMRMRWKSVVGRNPIFIDDAQRAKSHPLGIPIVGKAEGVLRLEPAVISTAAFGAGTNLNHGRFSFHC